MFLLIYHYLVFIGLTKAIPNIRFYFWRFQLEAKDAYLSPNKMGEFLCQHFSLSVIEKTTFGIQEFFMKNDWAQIIIIGTSAAATADFLMLSFLYWEILLLWEKIPFNFPLLAMCASVIDISQNPDDFSIFPMLMGCDAMKTMGKILRIKSDTSWYLCSHFSYFGEYPQISTSKMSLIPHWCQILPKIQFQSQNTKYHPCT